VSTISGKGHFAFLPFCWQSGSFQTEFLPDPSVKLGDLLPCLPFGLIFLRRLAGDERMRIGRPLLQGERRHLKAMDSHRSARICQHEGSAGRPSR